MTESGLAALDRLLPSPKARIARRLLLAGERLQPRAFARRGFSLSRAQAAALAEFEQEGLATRVVRTVKGADGARKLLVELGSGELVETVAMPVGAACLSTQLGCGVGCRFCASGLRGLERNLASHEILEQLVHARRLAPFAIDRIVFMGMGEPSWNLPAVLEAAAVLRDAGGIGLRRQTLSTVGGVRVLARLLRASTRPCLALSLHAVEEDLRAELLPHAPRDPLPELLAAAGRYGRATGMPVQIEWTLLAGVNDSPAQVDRLCDLLRASGLRGYVNFIVYNPVPGLPYAPPPRERTVALVRRVKARGILATIRDSAGADVQAGCGQLRLRAPAGRRDSSREPANSPGPRAARGAAAP